MWILITIGTLAAVLGGAVYLLVRWSRLIYKKECRKKHKLITIIIPLCLFLMLGIACCYAFNLVNGILIMLHLEVFWMIWDLILFIWKKVFPPKSSLWKQSRLKPLWNGMPVILVVIYFSVGWFFAHHVYVTNYELNTEKSVGDLHIVQFADSHIGAVFHADKFTEYMDQIQAEDPDVVLITGDFVDDDTSREDMIGACEALSKLHPKYGTYFCFGNHDSGYYSEERRGWSKAELVQGLTENGVRILEDETALIADSFYIIGRADYSKEDENRGGRMSMKELMTGLDPSKYTIVMDHQPHDYENQTAAGVDLVLSGHTHGGQLFPIGIIGEWMGANCKTYGQETRDDTNFLVTSGIGDWAIKFKTACIAEYVVIDIDGN